MRDPAVYHIYDAIYMVDHIYDAIYMTDHIYDTIYMIDHLYDAIYMIDHIYDAIYISVRQNMNQFGKKIDWLLNQQFRSLWIEKS